jgi:hypothetical protein
MYKTFTTGGAEPRCRVNNGFLAPGTFIQKLRTAKHAERMGLGRLTEVAAVTAQAIPVVCHSRGGTHISCRWHKVFLDY